MQWHPQVADPQHAPLGHGTPPDPDVEPVAPLRETNSELLVRQLLQAATDQHSQECRSQAVNKPTSSGLDPQMQQPCLFVPWKRAAELIGILAVQAVPLPNLREGVLHAVNLPEPQQQEFRAAYTDAVESIPTLGESVETLAPLILEDRVKKASQHRLWALVLKHMAEHHGFWLTTATAPPPECVQIHCGGLGGGALGGSDAPTFDCTNPRVDGTCVGGVMELGPFSGHLFLLFSPSLHLLPVITRSIWFFLALGLVAWQHHPSAMAMEKKKHLAGLSWMQAHFLPRGHGVEPKENAETLSQSFGLCILRLCPCLGHCTWQSLGFEFPPSRLQAFGWSLSLAPVDRPGEKITGVAAGATTCLHELAMLISLTVQPCRRWQELGFGRASVLYRRTQIMLEAARLVPAHRRLPHVTFLNGLWWKLLALQPERIIACLPNLQPSSRSISADELYCPAEFCIEGYSAGSYTGAVLFLVLRRLFPTCRLSAKLGAVAMPKGVFAMLQTKAIPGRCRIHLIHAEEDLLCDWQPSQFERHVIAHRLDYTVVSGSDKWMGASKHQYLHWLRCQLPLGRHELAHLKLRHPEVIPVRDRMAAPLRLASWVRFETVMDRHQWSTAIALLVPSIHLPDDALLALLNQCVPDQGITSMEEAQALLLRNFRVGGCSGK